MSVLANDLSEERGIAVRVVFAIARSANAEMLAQCIEGGALPALAGILAAQSTPTSNDVLEIFARADALFPPVAQLLAHRAVVDAVAAVLNGDRRDTVIAACENILQIIEGRSPRSWYFRASRR
jgi:hypothetical protein